MCWNIYEATFTAKCPADGDMITYKLRLAVKKMIRVEAINKAVVEITEGYHEEIADRLFTAFGGMQTISATHQGVKILTMREPGTPSHNAREWAMEQLCAA